MVCRHILKSAFYGKSVVTSRVEVEMHRVVSFTRTDIIYAINTHNANLLKDNASITNVG